eukprot:CAMPEP_0114582572 /NCGR_PEP_ID=MMETSP0125-20121206/6521_1 /TAXON_ID=485358 ORGANISM="Aristerostoma sp., Strain ATCC 50986" /NCGR_SAMPLE_ID=MMETSP0125 /ASSEMBLY_ACC=CAM_ASM_000245 /LENGTH=53 /DNA_ID=CAMNT_0001775595 /DNA_START=913 /DNA_END=1074 /DNA_ORIENTATION=+
MEGKINKMEGEMKELREQMHTMEQKNDKNFEELKMLIMKEKSPINPQDRAEPM